MGVFTKQSELSVGKLTEGEIIDRFVATLADACPAFPAGPGGDCAILPATQERPFRVATIDSVVFGRHFDLSCPGEKAGAKLIQRNLSDLAAAGATPGDALLSILMGPDVEVKWLEDFAYGAGRAAAQAGLKLVGGDVCRTAPGTFSATLAVQGFAYRVLTRRTAQVGDVLFVTGHLGGSIYGHHLNFKARLAEGEWLCAQGAVTACTDLSDGLGKDLPGLLGPKLDALVDLKKLPISEAATKLARQDGKPALEHALQDGEDYELLFTVRADQADFIAATFTKTFPGTPLTTIGTIAKGNGRLCDAVDQQPIKAQGFSHFG